MTITNNEAVDIGQQSVDKQRFLVRLTTVIVGGMFLDGYILGIVGTVIGTTLHRPRTCRWLGGPDRRLRADRHLHRRPRSVAAVRQIRPQAAVHRHAGPLHRRFGPAVLRR